MELSGGLASQLLDAAPYPIVAVAADGTIVFASAAIRTVLGYRPEEVTGRALKDLLHARCHVAYEQHAQLCRRAAGAKAVLYALHRSGRELPVEVSSAPASTHGPLMLSELRNVSEEQRLARELNEAHEAMSRIRDVANHELRQPLQALNLLNSAAARQVDANSALDDILQRQRQALSSMAELLSTLFEDGRSDGAASCAVIAPQRRDGAAAPRVPAAQDRKRP